MYSYFSISYYPVLVRTLHRFYYDGVAPSASVLVHALEALAAAGHTSLSLDSFTSFGHTPGASRGNPISSVECASLDMHAHTLVTRVREGSLAAAAAAERRNE